MKHYTDLLKKAAEKRLSLHELNAVVRHHVPGGVISTDTPQEVIEAVLRDLEAGNSLQIPILPRTLEHVPVTQRRMPLPTDLPVSLSFRPRSGEPWALEPVYVAGFKQGVSYDFVRRHGWRCRYCGLRSGDPYEVKVVDADGRVVRTETRVSRAPQAAHLTNDPARCGDEDLAPACPNCHDDSVHRWSAASLTKAAEPTGTRLTVICRDQWLSRGREAVQEGGLPALGVGGSDLLVAHALDLGLPALPSSLRRLIPELNAATDLDLRRVIRASLARLRMRGLLNVGRDTLRRPLCLPPEITETPLNPNPAARSRLSRPRGGLGSQVSYTARSKRGTP